MSSPTIPDLTERLRQSIAAAAAEHDKVLAERDAAKRQALQSEAARLHAEEQLAEARRALADADLSNDDSDGSIRVRFSFPAPVRTACEQYLLYFAEFLRDLGIESRASVREQVGSVLFKVTPATPHEALNYIREALRIYLNLPATPVDDGDSDDIAVQRLSANVYHLKSQLALAAAMVRTQQTSIEAQSITIATQRDILEGRLVAGALRKDSEALFGGIVDVVPVEGKGFRINLPQLFRRLRERLQK